MLTLLKAQNILNIGLTCTQVFYLVGKQAAKGLCRFVKTDSIKTAISTLLSIKGDKANVEDIRLNDFGGLKVFTNQGIKHLPRSEVRAFLTNYNRLATVGCQTECKCAQDPEILWKDFCIHKIAEHLTSVKEKIEAITKPTPQPQTDITRLKVKRLLDEVMYYAREKNLVALPFEEDSDHFIKLCKQDKTELGYVIITSDGLLRMLSAEPGSREVRVSAVASAIAQALQADRTPQGVSSPPNTARYLLRI